MTNTAEKLETPIAMVPAEKIMAVWKRVEPLLKRVVRPHSGYSLINVLTELQLNRMQLWVIGDFQAVAVTSLQQRPLHKILWVQFLAGDHMDSWLDDWETVQLDYARHCDCAAVEFCGRKGWGKLNKHHPEYKPVWTIYRREL